MARSLDRGSRGTVRLTLAVNMLAGYTINRVTLRAILSLGLLVDDPIVDGKI